MSEVRVAAEHTYKDLKQLWKSKDYARNMKVKRSPIVLLYKEYAILNNMRVCLYNTGQINSYFDFRDMSLDEYLEEEDREG